ncbi:MAG: M48 family metalloprotease [Bdellovibrionota bacterium]
MDTEHSINAFAAGYTVSDAVIGVTRGTVDRLSREELQGVIGHEFSHILNGDMRLNIRLMGMLHGILVLGLIGRMALGGNRSSRRSRSRKGDGGLALIGLTLIIIGSVGHFLANSFKPLFPDSVNFLADASAVQFTRNTNGIANALKKIGGYMGMPASGSHLFSTNRQEIAHMTFASVNFSEMFGWTSSHPNIEKRIQALDRSFDPKREKKWLRCLILESLQMYKTSKKKKNHERCASTILNSQSLKKSNTLPEAFPASLAPHRPKPSINKVSGLRLYQPWLNQPVEIAPKLVLSFMDFWVNTTMPHLKSTKPFSKSEIRTPSKLCKTFGSP